MPSKTNVKFAIISLSLEIKKIITQILKNLHSETEFDTDSEKLSFGTRILSKNDQMALRRSDP